MPARESDGRGAESAACARAIADARRLSGDLTKKRIPQYMALGPASDAGHFKAILQKQQALRHALKRIALYCRARPREFAEWEQTASRRLKRP